MVPNRQEKQCNHQKAGGVRKTGISMQSENAIMVSARIGTAKILIRLVESFENYPFQSIKIIQVCMLSRL